MQETKYIWMDGKLIDWKQAKVHVLAHSLHYGSAVFEGIRFYETKKGSAVFRLNEHTDRLFNSAATFEMEIPFSKDEINKAIIETIKANEVKSGYIRPIIFFGYGVMGLNPTGAPVNVAIAVWPWGAYLGEKPVKIKISSFIRTHPETTNPNAKISGNYQNSIIANQEIKKQGYDEALLLDYNGNITEGPGENLFIIKDGKLITPPLGNILPGITRNSIITIAKDIGIQVEEREIKPKQVFDADEGFFTGTAAEVTAIHSVDENEFKESPGEITKKIRDIYFDIIHGKNERYINWLTFVK